MNPAHDDEGDDNLPWFVRPPESEEEEDAAPRPDVFGFPAADQEIAAWAAAEAELMGPLGHVAHLIGRLDERLAIDATMVGAGEGPLAARQRAAHAVDLLWTAGWTVRAEKLALHAADGGAPRDVEANGRAGGYALGLWLLNRLARPADLTSSEGVAGFLGWSQIGEPERRRELPERLQMIVRAPDPAEREAAIARWLALNHALQGRHPLTRGAALAQWWARHGPEGHERGLAAALLGARRSVVEEDARGRGGLVAAPIAMRFSGRARAGGTADPGEAAQDLEDWLAASRRGADRALATAAALDVWRGGALAWAAKTKGETAARLVEALTRQEALSASMAAAALSVSQSTAERQLARLEAAGLAREITGGGSWRFWTARA